MTEENISAIRARLKFKNLDDFAKGYARYISSGGIFIPMASDRLKPVGALIRFQFLLSDGSTALLGEGRVHQVRSNSSSGKAPIGMLVKFTKLSQTSKKLVERIVVAKKSASAPEPIDSSISEHSEPTQEAPVEEESSTREPAEPEKQASPAQPHTHAVNDLFGPSSGHSSLEEETRAGPSPNDVTPTKHLEPGNQPDTPEADDAPTRDGEVDDVLPVPEEAPGISPPVNPFEIRADSSPSDEPAPELNASTDDPPTREVEVDDAQNTPTAEQDDPYAIDLFGDLDLGLNQPEPNTSAHTDDYDPSIFESNSGEPPAPTQEQDDTSDAELEEGQAQPPEEHISEPESELEPDEEIGSDEELESDEMIEPEPSSDDQDEPSDAPQEDIELAPDEDEAPHEDLAEYDLAEALSPPQESHVLSHEDLLLDDLVEASLSSLDAAQEPEQPSQEEPLADADVAPSILEESAQESSDEAIKEDSEPINVPAIPEDPAPFPFDLDDAEDEPEVVHDDVVPNDVEHHSTELEAEEPEATELEATAEPEAEEPEEIEAEEPDHVEPADAVPSASPARSLNSIKLPPPPSFTSSSLPDLPGAEDIDLDLIFGDDDDLLGDIMRPGLTATAQPLTIPTPATPEPEPELEPEPESKPEPESEPLLTEHTPDNEDTPSLDDKESEAIDLFEIVSSAVGDDIPSSEELPSLTKDDDLEAGQAPPSFTPEALAAPSPRRLAETEGGLQVLAYDDSTVFEHGLDVLSVADDAEDIDLMFNGIFSGSSGESEDDIFGDMFSTQSLTAISQADDMPDMPEPIEEEEPSLELTNLLDNLESDEDQALGIDELDLQGASFAEEDKPSQEEEDESLAALLMSARQDIDKIQQHKLDEDEDDVPGDALLANLLGDEALEAPADEEIGVLPIPEPKKKEKRGLFSKLFGKDD